MEFVSTATAMMPTSVMEIEKSEMTQVIHEGREFSDLV
jgi:hypothetical protein